MLPTPLVLIIPSCMLESSRGLQNYLYWNPLSGQSDLVALRWTWCMDILFQLLM